MATAGTLLVFTLSGQTRPCARSRSSTRCCASTAHPPRARTTSRRAAPPRCRPIVDSRRQWPAYIGLRHGAHDADVISSSSSSASMTFAASSAPREHLAHIEALNFVMGNKEAATTNSSTASAGAPSSGHGSMGSGYAALRPAQLRQDSQTLPAVNI
ncbi:hypothetical protein T492DRAFT_1055014 [Pavlovales sp. CCMP2436]|nr:hypothetical protein T492DRAFT_1055014 [Pavlovales sp. CCMP2436]